MSTQNYILFEHSLKLIKHKPLQLYLLEFFLLKKLLIRIAWMIALVALSATVFFVLRAASLEEQWAGVHFNTGIAWSWGNDWDQSVVYLIKIIPTVILLGCSFAFNQWYLYVPLFLGGVNSLYNIIDKSLVDVYGSQIFYDAVVDNLKWSGLGFTNNFADLFIIFSFICLLIAIGYEYYIAIKKDRAAKTEQAAKEPHETTDHSSFQ